MIEIIKCLKMIDKIWRIKIGCKFSRVFIKNIRDIEIPFLLIDMEFEKYEEVKNILK